MHTSLTLVISCVHFDFLLYVSHLRLLIFATRIVPWSIPRFGHPNFFGRMMSRKSIAELGGSPKSGKAGNVVLRPELLGEFQAYAEKQTGVSKVGAAGYSGWWFGCHFYFPIYWE